MKKLLNSFFAWYEKHKTLNTSIAAGLFTLQLLHLYWMTTHVLALKLFGHSLFDPQGLILDFLLVVDYTEIPAIITTSLLYINELRKGFNSKSLWFLFFLNTQWLHIFWITDEYALEQFLGAQSIVSLPFWLALLAIFIDYLELPVIYDTIKRLVKELMSKKSV